MIWLCLLAALGACGAASWCHQEWKRHQPGPWFTRRGPMRSIHG